MLALSRSLSKTVLREISMRCVVDVHPIQRTHAASAKHLFHGIFDYKNQQSPFCFADFQRLNLLGESRFCHSTYKNPRPLFRLKKSRFYRIILQKRFGNFAT